MPDALFPRSFDAETPVAARGEGVYIYDEQGRRFLDACGGAAVVTIGHGVREVIDAMAEQAAHLAYTHSSQFQTRIGMELAEFLGDKLPGSRVWFTSGGSEATETALKLARQYWISQPRSPWPCSPRRTVKFTHEKSLEVQLADGHRHRVRLHAIHAHNH